MRPEAQVIARNPGYLKLELTIHGMKLDPSARAREEVSRATEVREGLTRGVELVLPEDLWVRVPIDERFTADSPFTLRAEGDRLILEREGDGSPPAQLEVRAIPPPEFYRRRTSRGTPASRIGTVHGGYVTIDPAGACGFSLRGVPCQFCTAGARRVVDREYALPVADVVEVVRAAFEEGAAEFVYFNTGFFDTPDGGIVFLQPYIEAIKRHFDTLVAVQVHPPKSNRWIDRTYAMGVDALSYNVEIFDPDTLDRYCRGRVAHIGRQRYFDALAYAASIYPSGTVWSDLIVGLEPLESTIRGINALTEIGVLPVLSIFRPLDEIALRDHPLPAVADVAHVYAHLYQAVRRRRIHMGWLRDLSVAITPLEARFFVGDEARWTVALQNFTRSRLGSLTARGLARLRRRLRVRTVSESFDSARL